MRLNNLNTRVTNVISDTVCPKCKKQGILVKNYTVQHLIKDEHRFELGIFDHYLCMNEICDIVYYNSKMNKVFLKEDVRVPIWFKKDADPKYACYCSKVTEQEVIDSVFNQGATTMKDVMKITGAMNNSQCQKMNPLGKCCHQIILEAIDKGIQLKNSKQ